MRNKYGNKKTKIDDITFDSKAEANFYLLLKEKKKKKEIKDFEIQVKYNLLESYIYNNKKVQGIHYITDFKIIENDGSEYLVDVKGKLTEVFKLKLKMFRAKYDIELKLLEQKTNGFFDIEKKVFY